jgi:hypothetical protein
MTYSSATASVIAGSTRPITQSAGRQPANFIGDAITHTRASDLTGYTDRIRQYSSTLSTLSTVRGSSVGTATTLPRTGRYPVRNPTRLDQLWGSHSLLFKGYKGSFVGVKRPDRHVDHSTQPNAKAKNEWSYTFTTLRTGLTPIGPI